LFQTEFAKGIRTADHIFIIKKSVDKYMKEKRGRLHWRFDSDKSYLFINREAL